MKVNTFFSKKKNQEIFGEDEEALYEDINDVEGAQVNINFPFFITKSFYKM